MKALIDLDILPYSYGSLTFEDGTLMPLKLVQRKVDEKIKSIVRESGADDWVGYLTDSGSNFRLDIATILPYKGNRSGTEKPPLWKGLREYLMEAYPDQVTEVVGIEADDQLAIDQYTSYDIAARALVDTGCTPYEFSTVLDECYKHTIICSIDKDLMMVPGYHYNWNKEEVVFVTEVVGIRSFYKQLLTGDTCDNIKGLHGVGAKSKLVTSIDDMDEEQDMFLHVQEQYEKRFGSYADQFLLENGRLLWMLKDRDTMWEFPPIIIEDEEDERENNDLPF